MRLLIAAVAAIAIAGCASQPYRDTREGKFSGALDVRWVKNDYFRFIPNSYDPFTFTRFDGTRIRPGTMHTDGGSIPRFFWGVPGFSPWGYAPAYIIHDWLFRAKQCGYTPDNKFRFSESADVLAEGLKAIMETDQAVRNYFVFDSVYSAVKSPIAERLWERGRCEPGPDDKGLYLTEGELIMTIRFK